jgi:hypothetical protein
LPAVVSAKVECLSIALDMESGRFVHGHPADGVFGHGFCCCHGYESLFLLLVSSFDLIAIITVLGDICTAPSAGLTGTPYQTLSVHSHAPSILGPEPSGPIGSETT